MNFKLRRKPIGRSYSYHVGKTIPKNWYVEDEVGNKYRTTEEVEDAVNKEKQKRAPVKKKAVTKKKIIKE